MYLCIDVHIHSQREFHKVSGAVCVCVSLSRYVNGDRYIGTKQVTAQVSVVCRFGFFSRDQVSQDGPTQKG